MASHRLYSQVPSGCLLELFDRFGCRQNQQLNLATLGFFLSPPLSRISLLVGVFKALNTLYSQKLADAWISLPNNNPMFAGEAPLSYMVKGGQPAMIRVRQLLDSRRAGG
jgi:hypothetical protein